MQPYETVILSGFVCKRDTVEYAVTEHSDFASSKIGICPRVVKLNNSGSTTNVPVKQVDSGQSYFRNKTMVSNVQLRMPVRV